MYQLWLIFEIIMGWTMIIGILNYMIDDGLFDELRRLFKDLRRRG